MDLGREAVKALRNADFPVFVVPPAEWPGDVMVGSAWGTSKHPLSIGVRYSIDLLVERSEKELEILSTGPDGLSRRPPHHADLLWEHSYSTTILNFVHNRGGVHLLERPIPGSERYNAEMIDGEIVPRTVQLPSAGPRHMIDVGRSLDGYQVETVAFEEWPQLRLARAQMGDTEVLILAWGWDDEFLQTFASSIRSVEDDEDLLADLERAEYAAWEKIRKRKKRE